MFCLGLSTYHYVRWNGLYILCCQIILGLGRGMSDNVNDMLYGFMCVFGICENEGIWMFAGWTNLIVSTIFFFPTL